MNGVIDNTFFQKKLEKELQNMTVEQLKCALLDGLQLAKTIVDEADWKIHSDTLIVINAELDKRNALTPHI